MMKGLFVLLFIFSFLGYSVAQTLDFKVKWGKEFKASSKSSLNDIVGHDANGIYVVKERYRGAMAGGTDFTLEHFDNNFSPTKSFDLDIEEDGKEAKVDYLLHLKNKIFLFYSVADRKTKVNTLFVKEVDKTTLQLKEEKKKIGEINYEGKSKKNTGEFFFRISRDSSKVMVVYSLPYEEDDPQSFGFNVLDDN